MPRHVLVIMVAAIARTIRTATLLFIFPDPFRVFSDLSFAGHGQIIDGRLLSAIGSRKPANSVRRQAVKQPHRGHDSEVAEMRIAAQVLDGTYGQTAAGIRAHLQCADDAGWTTIANAVTDHEGRLGDWKYRSFDQGVYRIVLDSDSYFASLGVSSPYPEVIIMFRMLNQADSWQLRVTICPYSYSTYFGATDNQANRS